MGDIASVIGNAGSSLILGIYAWKNRYGNISGYMGKRFPKIKETYIKWSPTIEHFIFGYALTSGGYAMDEAFSIVKNTNSANNNAYAEFLGGVAISSDLVWEGYQAKERKKILPEQFLGTCAGISTAVIVNNLENISKIFS